MELNTETLESLCELVVDCPHSTPKWTDSGIIVLRNQNIKNGVLDLSNPSFTNEEDYQKRVKRAVPRAGDIVITREAPMGEVCIIPQGLKCCLGQRQVLLRPRNEICGEYLFWALQSPYVQHQISWNEGTGTTVSNVRIPVLKGLMIPRYPKTEKKSAYTLSTLAKKLELNKQTNQTLEQMAQALFKSWFVDFDPVFDNLLAGVDFNLDNLETSLPDELKLKAQRRLAALNSLKNAAECKASLSALDHELQALSQTKEATQAAVQVSEKAAETPVKANFNTNPNILAQHANTHAHFPKEFEHNEQLGWIPKGWEYGPFSKIAVLKTESVHPKKSPDKLWSQFSLPAFDSGKTPTLDLGIEIKSGKYKLSDNVVLVSKLNPQTPRVWMPNVVDVESSVCSTEFMPFEPILKEHKPFIYALMSSKFIQTEIASRVTGTTGSHQRVSPKNIAVLDVILPSENCIKLYCEMVGSSFNKINLISSQSTELTKLRDTLLPKLISGELQIPDVATDKEIVE